MDTPEGAIVVGVDTSADSRRAVEWAAGAATRRGAPLHLLHAFVSGLSEIPPTPKEYRDLRYGAQCLLEEAGTWAREGRDVAVTSEIVDVPPATALIEASRSAGMAVVGAQGHSAAAGLLLGSVSRHVSQHAACPVVVVREQANPRQRRVVVGVDGSPGADKAIGFAMETAAQDGAPLVALHGWHDLGAARGSSDQTHTVERIRAGERLLDEALAAWVAKYPEVDISREAVPVHPARLLADASEQAALVVVGSRGRGGFGGLLLGSVSQSVLHHSRCPVAVLR